MKAFVAVAVREFVDRRAVLVAALAAALIPVALPLLPGFAGHSVADVRGTTAWVVALCLGWVLAAGLGASMVATELAEGRMGFFFSRPLRPTVIWLGKLAASFALIVGAELLVLLPTALMASNRPKLEITSTGTWFAVAVLLCVPLVVLLATHAISVMIRARSAWNVVDVAAMLGVAFALWALVSPLMFLVPEAFAAAVVFIVVSLVAALTAAGAAQMAVGRTDVQRSHRALSLVLWSALGLCSLVVAGFSWWMFAVEPDDLVAVGSVQAAPAGDWVVVEGPTRGRFDFHPCFLFNTETGSSRRLPSAAWYGAYPVTFSRDGKRAAWVHPEGKDYWQLVYADLGEGEPEVISSGLLFNARVRLQLSDGGGRVAVLEKRVVSIYDVMSTELLVAVPLDEKEWVPTPRWIGDDVVRLSRGSARESEVKPTTITEVDVVAGTVRDTGWLGPEADYSETPHSDLNRSVHRYDPVRDRILEIIGQGDKRSWLLRDGHTGEIIADLGKRGNSWSTAFMGDGRIVHVLFDADGFRLESVSIDGEPERTVFLGDWDRVVLGGEVEPGLITLSVTHMESDDWKTSQWTALVVDLNDGSKREIPGAAWPADWIRLHEAGVLGNGRLFLDANERLVEWDPETGETRPVL